MIYRHTQFGWVVVGLIGAVILLMLGVGIREIRGILPAMIFLGVVLLLFCALTVEIDGDRLRFWFGIGLIRKCIPLDRITTCKSVRNHWFCGWGIRWWGRGWLYNVSGFQAVEIELKTGKRLRLGTDQPEALSQAIHQATQAGRS